MEKDSSPDLILAIDHGTSGIKNSIMTFEGRPLDFDFEPTPLHLFPNGGAEQDPDDWWAALVATTRRLLDRTGTADRIAALCVSSTFSTTVAVGADGRNLGPALTWMDSRGAPYIRQAVSGFPSIMGYGLAKMLPWIRKTGGGPQLSGKDDIAHVLFWKHERPELYRQAAVFLGSKDFLNLRLTGKVAGGADSMTLFWVTDTRDIGHIKYDDGLIRMAGLDRAKLPPLRSSVDVLGTLTAGAASELGLPPGVKVVVGSADHQSAGVGSGATLDFAGHLYIGTSSWIQCIVPFKKTDPFHSIASIPSAIPGRYYCVNEQDIAGGALNFLVKILWPQNALRPEPPPPDAFQRLDAAAAASPPGAHGVIFTPWLNGERTPVDDPYLRAGFHNLSLGNDAPDLVRAALEGVALNSRWALKYGERFIGRRMDALNIIGGGAQSDLWCRIFADVLGREIRQVQDPMQANARGAALIAAVALGKISFGDVPGLVKIKATYKPDPALRGLYDRRFQDFLEIYQKNHALYRRLNQKGE